MTDAAEDGATAMREAEAALNRAVTACVVARNVAARNASCEAAFTIWADRVTEISRMENALGHLRRKYD